MRLNGRELLFGEARFCSPKLSYFSTTAAKKSGLVNRGQSATEINEGVEVGGVREGQLTQNRDYTY
jgi:hypothetical protein